MASHHQNPRSASITTSATAAPDSPSDSNSNTVSGAASTTAVTTPASTKARSHLARVRDNQRRSRARRKDYLQDLESKFRRCEQLGVEASADMQIAARRVLDENMRLRHFLHSRGFSDEDLDAATANDDDGQTDAGRVFGPASDLEWLIDRPEASASSPAAELHGMIATRRSCCTPRHGSLVDASPTPPADDHLALPPRGSVSAATDHPAITQTLPVPTNSQYTTTTSQPTPMSVPLHTTTSSSASPNFNPATDFAGPQLDYTSFSPNQQSFSFNDFAVPPHSSAETFYSNLAPPSWQAMYQEQQRTPAQTSFQLNHQAFSNPSQPPFFHPSSSAITTAPLFYAPDSSGITDFSAADLLAPDLQEQFLRALSHADDLSAVAVPDAAAFDGSRHHRVQPQSQTQPWPFSADKQRARLHAATAGARGGTNIKRENEKH